MIRKAITAGLILGAGLFAGWILHSNLETPLAFASPQRDAPAREPAGNRPAISPPVIQAPVIQAPAIQAPAIAPAQLAPAQLAPGQLAPGQLAAAAGQQGGLVVGPASGAPIVSPPALQLPEGFVPTTTEEAVHVAVYEAVNRGVVNISTRAVRPEAFLLVAEIEGNGSGSIIDQQGHVLTNYHVIEGARDINVTLFNGESFPAELVGQDPDNDIAVLKISAPVELLFPITWGDSSNLRVGQHIIAIGNPFGLERTMSTGIISSLNRQITSKTRRSIRSIIQIDAALNQGNSGGPLVNSRGELIGMNTAIATRSGDNAGIGFAIPVNTMSRVVPQLIATGRVARPTIGILQVFETERGLLIVNMTPNGPAEKAGLQGSRAERRKVRRGFGVFEQETVDHSQADLIISIDGQKVKQADDLLSVIETKKAGDTVSLTVIRDGKSLQVPVTLGSGE